MTKITSYLDASQGKTLFSIEIIPPMKGQHLGDLMSHIEPLMEFKPSWINVTYHRAEQVFKKRLDGTFERVDIRKRPGTVGICAAIMNRYGVDAVPHLICGGFSKEETENALIDLHFLGVNNVLALRGDAPSNEKFFTPHPHGHHYADDLVQQIADLNKGKYQEDDMGSQFVINNPNAVGNGGNIKAIVFFYNFQVIDFLSLDPFIESFFGPNNIYKKIKFKAIIYVMIDIHFVRH